MSTILPSSNRLPAVTAGKLQEVCQRRKQLLLLKSLGVATTTFLGVLLVAAFIDMWWNLSASARWGLSGSVYGIATLAAILSSLPFFRNWGLSEAANLIEQFIPSLKNRVMAAVDLAVDSDAPKFGSRSLRERLQNNVAEQIDGLRVSEVLPWNHAQRALAVCGAMSAATLILCLIPQLQLPQHLLRMLLPAANIARPSLATIELLNPADTGLAVPLNERLLVRAGLNFKRENDRRQPRFVQVEWRSGGVDSKTTLHPMIAESVPGTEEKPQATSDLIFTSSVDVQDSQSEFRIVSDVGESIWYSLRAYPRPKAESYKIEVHAPDYAKVPPTTIEATAADLEMIASGKAILQVKASERLSKAMLRWLDVDTDAGEKELEPFSHQAENFWGFESQPQRTRRFQIDLVSDHGIESTFPLTYRMTVREDLPPKLQWIEPKESARVIRPKSAARMTVAFRDEYPLAAIEQWIRINRGDWRKRTLQFSEVAEGEVDWTWELASLGLKLGDMVDTKVVAVDRKGATGESPIVEWIISGTELDATREDATLAREEIANALRELGEFATLQNKALTESATAWRADKPNTGKEQELQTAIFTANKALLGNFESVQVQIQQRMSRVNNLVSREELIQVMAAVANIQSEAEVLQATWEQHSNRDRLKTGNSHNSTEHFVQWSLRLLQASQRIHESYRRMVPHDVLADFSRDLLDAARYQEELLRDPNQIGEEIWNREQRVLAEHLRALSREMLAHSGFLPEGPSRGLADWAGWSEQMSERMESFCAQEAPKNEQERKQRKDEVDRILKELQYRGRANQLHSGLPNELIAGRRELMQIAGRPNEILTRAIQDWHANRQLQADAELLPAHFMVYVKQLESRRQSHHSAGDYSAMAGSDLGLAYRAIVHQMDMNRGDSKKTEQVMQVINDCVAILETESRLRHAQRWLEQLQDEERFAANGNFAITENPRIWDSWGIEIEVVQDFIRRSQIRNESADILNALRWSTAAQAAAQKFSVRRWETKPSISASSEVDSVQQEVNAQYDLMKVKFDAARDRLRQLAPSIPELAKEAAQLARDQQERTEELKENFEKGEVPNVDERLNQNAEVNQERQEEVAEQLQAALTDLAASQNILDEDQLQTAKTADLARALQQRAEEKREEAFDAALAAEQPETSNALEELAETQAKEAETLQAIAEHYEQDPLAPKNSSKAEQQSPLEELAQSLDAQSENTEAYDKAESLARLAEADPRELLRRLEQELQTNEQMQEELSDIAKNLAEQAQQTVEQAAEREKNLRSALTQSDPLREPRRQELAQEVNNALDQANRLAQRLAQETQNQASLGKQPEERAQLQKVAEDLYKALDQARQQASSQLPEDMRRAAEQLGEALKAAEPQVQQAAQSLAQGKQEQQFEDANKLQQAKTNAERVQAQVQEQDQRFADQNLRMREQKKQAAERAVQQSQQQLAQAERQRDQAREQASKNPDNESLKNALANAEADVQEKKAQQSQAEQSKTQAEQRLTEAQQRRTALDTKPGSLDAPSPNTELAARLAEQVAQQAEALRQDTQEIVEQSSWIEQLEASRQQLANAATQQQTLQEAVADAARDLDRAANHQARLNAPQSAQALADAAQRVNSTAENEAQQAENQLQAAGNPQGASNPRYASAEETRNATNALQNSQNALQARASELGQLLADQEAQAQAADAAAASEATQPSDSSQANNTAQANNTTQTSETAQPGQSKQPSSANQPGNTNQTGSTAAANNPSASDSMPNDQQPGEENLSTPAGPEQLADTGDSASMNDASSQEDQGPLSPREMAELLDELDRQLRDPSGNIKPDSLAQSASQEGTESLSSLRNSQQQITQQLQQTRASAESQSQTPTMVVTREPSQAKTSQGIFIPNPNGSGSSKVFSTDQLTGEPLGAWSRLREKKSEEVAESQREAVAPRYRRQIENYFRTLSERNSKQ